MKCATSGSEIKKFLPGSSRVMSSTIHRRRVTFCCAPASTSWLHEKATNLSMYTMMMFITRRKIKSKATKEIIEERVSRFAPRREEKFEK